VSAKDCDLQVRVNKLKVTKLDLSSYLFTVDVNFCTQLIKKTNNHIATMYIEGQNRWHNRLGKNI